MGQGVLAAPDHVDSVADVVRLVAVELEDERRESGRFHVLLVSPPAEARLQCRGVRELQGRFVPVALEAQGLEILGLRGEGLVHGNDVVQLARGCGDGGRAQLALMVLLREQGLPRSGRIAAGLEKVKEDLARRARQTLPVIDPGLQHVQVFVEGGDDAVRRHRHSLMLRMTTFGQCPSARSSLRTCSRSSVKKWPLATSPSHSRQSLNSGVSPGFLSPRYLARSPIGSHFATVRADL